MGGSQGGMLISTNTIKKKRWRPCFGKATVMMRVAPLFGFLPLVFSSKSPNGTFPSVNSMSSLGWVLKLATSPYFPGLLFQTTSLLTVFSQSYHHSRLPGPWPWPFASGQSCGSSKWGRLERACVVMRACVSACARSHPGQLVLT